METAPQKNVHRFIQRFGGDGTGPDPIHNPDLFIPRPDFLIYRKEKARWLELDTHTIYYEVHGTGPKKVFAIMGMAGTHTEWEENALPFAGDEYSVCVFDNRGVGFSGTPTGRWRTSDMAHDCLHLLKHLEKGILPGEGEGWNAVHLMGASMGGMILLELSLLDPARILSMSLISTHCGGIRGTMVPLHGLPRFLKTFAQTDHCSIIEAAVELKFPNEFLDQPHRSADGNKNRYHEEFRVLIRHRKYVESGIQKHLFFNITGLIKQIGAVLTHYVPWHRLEHLAACNIPTLVVAGDADCLVHPINSRMLTKTLNGELLYFDDAGHVVNEQHAERVNEAMRRIFEKGERMKGEQKHLIAARRPYPAERHPYFVLILLWALTYLLRNKIPTKVLQLSCLVSTLITIKRYAGQFRII